MSETTDAVAVLTDDECWQRLAGQTLGRLVTHVGHVIDIFPVNYAIERHSLVFRTAEGSKLFELTVNEDVLFEIDDHTDQESWSVIVRGRAHRIDSARGIADADRLPLKPWLPALRYNYVRIQPDTLSGRAFHQAPEPDRYGVQQY